MKPVSLSVLALASQAIASKELGRRWSNEDNAWSSSVAQYLSNYAKGTATAKTVGPIRTFTQYDTITTAKTICNSKSVCSLSSYTTQANPRVFTETVYVSRFLTSCPGGTCLVATGSESVAPVTTTITSTKYYSTATTQCNSKSICSPVPVTRTSVVTSKAVYTPSLPPIAGVTGTTIRASSSMTTRQSTSSISTTTRATTAAAKGSSTVDATLQTTSKASTTSRLTTTSTTTRPPTTTTTTTTTKKSSTTTSAANAQRTYDVTGKGYQEVMMYVHNLHRANHSLPNLNWNQDLANTAQKIADSCKYGHNVTADGGGYGQNIGAGAPGNAAAGLITNLMYNGEIGYYPLPYGDDNPSLDNFHIWGHYSQLVWDDTTDVGCVTKYCPNGLANTGAGVAPYFTVCNYSPPGNYVGEFSSVAAPGGGPTWVVVGS